MWQQESSLLTKADRGVRRFQWASLLQLATTWTKDKQCAPPPWLELMTFVNAVSGVSGHRPENIGLKLLSVSEPYREVSIKKHFLSEL